MPSSLMDSWKVKAFLSVVDGMICCDNSHTEINVSAVNMELYNKIQLTYE